MTQRTLPTLEAAIASVTVPSIVYADPELGGFGTYALTDLDGRGSWVTSDMIVEVIGTDKMEDSDEL